MYLNLEYSNLPFIHNIRSQIPQSAASETNGGVWLSEDEVPRRIKYFSMITPLWSRAANSSTVIKSEKAGIATTWFIFEFDSSTVIVPYSGEACYSVIDTLYIDQVTNRLVVLFGVGQTR